MEEVELRLDELPEPVRQWLADNATVVISVERFSEGSVMLRALPGISAELIARAQVTMAKYQEALMNLT